MDIKTRGIAWLRKRGYSEEEISQLFQDETVAAEAFQGSLSFGTGGVRAFMGPGTSRMNIFTVRKLTLALARYIHRVGKERPSVVIGFDSRNNSKEFALEAAKVLTTEKIEVYLFEDLRPTPEVSFACRKMGSQAAIMITASHNPKEYNGYKVYWDDGAQVLFPHDQGILEEYNSLKEEDDLGWEMRNESLHFLKEEMDRDYIEALQKNCLRPQENLQKGSALKIVYTSLHGTGIRVVPKALERAGFSSLFLVKNQVEVAGDFPTVRVPNPEERGALSLGVDLLLKEKGDLLLATDPDADRLAVVVRGSKGPYFLRGNDLAVLGVYYLSLMSKQQGTLTKKSCVVRSFVTTPLFGVVARSFGVQEVVVPTGFKYIGEKIRLWEESGEAEFLFGAEESLGYLVGTESRDKDGVGAALLFAEMALWLKEEGKTLEDALYEIYSQFGIYREKQRSILLQGKCRDAHECLRRVLSSPPKRVGRFSLQEVFAENDAVVMLLSEEMKMVIRPSGTEPKIKVYGFIKRETSKDMAESIALADASLEEMLSSLEI